MTYAIVYSSQTGNTKLLADTIREELPKEDCLYFGLPSELALDADRIYVGFWTDKGVCNADTISFLKHVTTQEIYLFGTAGFGQTPEYFDKVLQKTEKHLPKSAKLIGAFMCQGKMPLSVRTRYEKLMHSPVPVPNLKAMIENFDQAFSHPNEHDLNSLKEGIIK